MNPVSASSTGIFLNRVFFLTIFAELYILVTGNAEAKRLYDDLMSSYNSLIRPVSNVSERLTVKMGVKLSQLVDVVSYTFFGLCSKAINHL